MKQKRTSFMSGFSLGEVLLSIAVLVIGILPVFTSLSRGYEVTAMGRHLVVASGLAQEGVELVQSIRNNGVLSRGSSEFSEWLPDDGATAWNDCRIDIGDPVLDPVTYPGSRIMCGGGSYDLTEGSQGMVHSGASGLFKRKVFMDYDASENSLEVMSVVYWGDTEPTSFIEARSDCSSTNQCVYAETKLSPWR